MWSFYLRHQRYIVLIFYLQIFNYEISKTSYIRYDMKSSKGNFMVKLGSSTLDIVEKIDSRNESDEILDQYNGMLENISSMISSMRQYLLEWLIMIW